MFTSKDIKAKILYNLCTRPEQVQWFTFYDCAYRYSLVLLAFCWALVTSPISFFVYTLEYNTIWYGKVLGYAMSIFFPVMPAFLCVTQVFVIIKKKFFDKSNWQDDGPGRVFFVKPKNPIGSFIWDCYLTQSMYVGQYFLVGTNKKAIEHTWVDTILTKDFWRNHLKDVNARVPRELARHDYDKFTRDNSYDIGNVVVKIHDSYLGIGDSFWRRGEDFNTVDELEEKVCKEYKGKEALVLEWVEPDPALGVHSLDIITVRTPDDDVKVLSVLVWADCTGSSSHTTHAGYTIDLETETVVAPTGWYSPFFATQSDSLVGTKYKGIREACEDAVQAHKNIKHKWLTAVGWDCMIMENDEVVFFEGNFAGARTPRRMFLSLDHLTAFIQHLFWPFGGKGSVRPGNQGFFSHTTGGNASIKALGFLVTAIVSTFFALAAAQK